MKKLYLDVCTLCRPFDDQNQMRIRLETAAVYLILQSIETSKYSLMVSPVHRKEIEAIAEVQEQIELTLLLNQYGVEANCDTAKARLRAQQLVALKFGIADAAHVAYAEQTAEVFISCDDKLLKRCRRHQVQVPALNPVDFCMQEDLR